MPLEPGTRLGGYEIGEALGAGGMGEVYRARDSKLGRSVAVKVLPAVVALDADRIARFEREARTLAALNHPHIAALFGMEQAGERHFLVMELVEGETLDRRVPMPVREALAVAQQIADAVEAAHEKAIIHRDLKPANIKITPDNKVKLLDFGLAKAMEPVKAGEVTGAAAESATRSVMATEAGVVLGTAAYMSPEQARGKPVDRRTDIWAFGCVLYEMLTGKKAFASGDSAPDVIAAILTGEVDWSALPRETPPSIHALLRRCLQKDPQQRLPHIGVARLEIGDDSLGSVMAWARPSLPRTPLWKRAAPVLVTGAVAGVLAAAAVWMWKPQPDPSVTRFSIRLPEGQAFTNTGRQAIAVSPDGLHVVYVANRRLYVRALSNEEPKPIAGTEHDNGVFHPVFSPDGHSIAFVAGAALKRVALGGGTPATVATVKAAVYGMSWNDDQLVFGDGGTAIMRVPVSGGTPTVLVQVEAPEVVSSPSMLPDGKHLLFSQGSTKDDPINRWDRGRVIVQSLETGERKTVVENASDGRLLPNGHLAYAVGGVVYGVPFDLQTLTMRGTPLPLIEGLRRGGPTGAAQFSASPSGSLAYLPGTPSAASESELFLTDAKGTTRRLNIRGGQYEQPRLSPDGKQVAFNAVDARGAALRVYELSGASATRPLSLEGNNRYPVWTADGQRLVFQSDRDGAPALFWQRADGAGSVERLTRSEPGTAHIPHSSSPDGRHLLFSAVVDRVATLWIYSFEDRKAAPVPGVTEANALGATFAPDGRWIAYYAGVIAEGRGTRVYVMRFPFDGTNYQVGGGSHPAWSADGRQLVIPRGARLVAAITITTQPSFRFGNAVEMSVRAMGDTSPELPRPFDIGRDGSMVGVITAGDLEALGDHRDIRVVINWNEELKRIAFSQ